MPPQPPGQAPVQPPPPGPVILPSWVAQSDADRLEEERREIEALASQAALPVAAPPPESHLIRKVLLWAGLMLGAVILLFGLLGIVSLSLSSNARAGSVAVAVVFVIFGAAVLVACLLRLLGYSNLGPVGVAIRLLPWKLDLAEQSGQEDEIDRAVAHDLIGDVDLAALCVCGLRDHAPSLLGWMPPIKPPGSAGELTCRPLHPVLTVAVDFHDRAAGLSLTVCAKPREQAHVAAIRRPQRAVRNLE
jgi:hypothetical protein